MDTRDLYKLVRQLSEDNDEIMELNDSFDLELNEGFIIETGIVGFTEDGVIVHLDEDAMEYLDFNGILLEDVADDSEVLNENAYQAVKSAISRRILNQHHDLLSKYGLDTVLDAIDEVADGFSGDELDEIGSSDVSIWVRHVIENLKRMQPDEPNTALSEIEDLDEGHYIPEYDSEATYKYALEIAEAIKKVTAADVKIIPLGFSERGEVTQAARRGRSISLGGDGQKGQFKLVINSGYVVPAEHAPYGATLENVSKAIEPYFRAFRAKGWTFTQPVGHEFIIGVLNPKYYRGIRNLRDPDPNWVPDSEDDVDPNWNPNLDEVTRIKNLALGNTDLEEGWKSKVLGGAALLAAILGGNKLHYDHMLKTDPQLSALVQHLETAQERGDMHKIRELKDRIKQTYSHIQATGRPVMGPDGEPVEPKYESMTEAEYQGRKVPLNKPMQGDVKKSKVYTKKPNGKVVKVNFGDKKMRIKKSNPGRRKNFRARHNCDNPGPKWKARYWSCKAW